MPLSEHEQRVLEQMEQALSAEDPRFATQMGTTELRSQRRKAAVGVLAALIGLGLIVLGVSQQQIWLGGIGFAAMVFGGAWAFTPSRGKPTLRVVDGQDTGSGPSSSGGRASKDHPSQGGRTPKPKGGFMDRLEERWDKRREQGPF